MRWPAPATFAVLSVGGSSSSPSRSPRPACAARGYDARHRRELLHADLCQFGMLSPLDRNDIAEYQRRRKLADRPVRFSLPRGRPPALVQRAALSHRASTTALRAS
ncbi:MAG: hypothetical protein ACLSVD_13580 [Eggerthellaceae bacterium]